MVDTRIQQLLRSFRDLAKVGLAKQGCLARCGRGGWSMSIEIEDK